jgi:hypothetical protein
MSIDAYSAEEHQRVIDAEHRYGDYYVNAYNATIMLSNIMMWPVSDCDVFIRFLSLWFYASRTRQPQPLWVV